MARALFCQSGHHIPLFHVNSGTWPVSRVQNDPAFAQAMLDEAVTLFFNGEPDTAKLILRDLVNATVGFESLAQDIHKPAKSLHPMLSPTQWRAATKAGIEELPEAAAGACEWQLWSYCPALLAGTGVVDPLSLTLSLQDNPDERIQLALDELKAQLPW